VTSMKGSRGVTSQNSFGFLSNLQQKGIEALKVSTFLQQFFYAELNKELNPVEMPFYNDDDRRSP